MKPSVRTEIKVDQDIILKVKRPDFADDFYSLIQVQTEYLSKWLPWVDYVTSPAAQAVSLTGFYNETMAGLAYEAAIFYQGQLAGSISFNEIVKENQQADIGYWLSADLQGKGIVSKSLKKLIDYGFSELGLHKIILLVAVNNLPSNRVAQRLGMTLEATLKDQIKLKTGFTDVNFYSLIN